MRGSIHMLAAAVLIQATALSADPLRSGIPSPLALTDGPVMAQLTNGVIIPDQARKSLRLCAFVSRATALNPSVVFRSEELKSGYSFRVHKGADAPDTRLCVIADDPVHRIHSISVAPYVEELPFLYTIAGAGAALSGRMLSSGLPSKSTVLLLDASGAVTGLAEAGPNGGYFFKNVPPGRGYTIAVAHPATGEEARTAPFDLAEQQTLENIDLSWPERTSVKN